ncbi:hypothetical protein HDR60_04785 [bacterium]|nr:hypothetical protein [bacterium]
MKNKKNIWKNIKKISVIISLIIMILSGIIYCTNIYDWINKNTNKCSSISINQNQSGNNISSTQSIQIGF